MAPVAGSKRLRARRIWIDLGFRKALRLENPTSLELGAKGMSEARVDPGGSGTLEPRLRQAERKLLSKWLAVKSGAHGVSLGLCSSDLSHVGKGKA